MIADQIPLAPRERRAVAERANCMTDRAGRDLLASALDCQSLPCRDSSLPSAEMKEPRVIQSLPSGTTSTARWAIELGTTAGLLAASSLAVATSHADTLPTIVAIAPLGSSILLPLGLWGQLRLAAVALTTLALAQVWNADGSSIAALVATGGIAASVVGAWEASRARTRRGSSVGRLRRLAAHLDSSRETGRQRLARRLHDEVAQPLAALGLNLSGLSRRLQANEPASQSDLRELNRAVATLVTTVRQMIVELRPSVLDDFGLAVAIRREIEDYRERTGIACAVSVEGTEIERSDDHAVAVFRTLQEALANCANRHAREVCIDVLATDKETSVSVDDDGSSVPPFVEACDLLGMRERIEMLGGRFELDSRRTAGVRMRWVLPGQSALYPSA